MEYDCIANAYPGPALEIRHHQRENLFIEMIGKPAAQCFEVCWRKGFALAFFREEDQKFLAPCISGNNHIILPYHIPFQFYYDTMDFCQNILVDFFAKYLFNALNPCAVDEKRSKGKVLLKGYANGARCFLIGGYQPFLVFFYNLRHIILRFQKCGSI